MATRLLSSLVGCSGKGELPRRAAAGERGVKRLETFEQCTGPEPGCRPMQLEFREVGEGQGQYEMVPMYYYVGTGGRYDKKIADPCKGWNANQYCVVVLLVLIFLVLVLLSLVARIAAASEQPSPAEAKALQLRSSTSRARGAPASAGRTSTTSRPLRAHATSRHAGTSAHGAAPSQGGGRAEERPRYNCMDFSHKWSREHKLWCCLQDGSLLICPDTSTSTTAASGVPALDRFNCTAGFPGLKNQWSRRKKESCCQRHLPIWTPRQREWCCRQAGGRGQCPHAWRSDRAPASAEAAKSGRRREEASSTTSARVAAAEEASIVIEEPSPTTSSRAAAAEEASTEEPSPTTSSRAAAAEEASTEEPSPTTPSRAAAAEEASMEEASPTTSRADAAEEASAVTEEASAVTEEALPTTSAQAAEAKEASGAVEGRGAAGSSRSQAPLSWTGCFSGPQGYAVRGQSLLTSSTGSCQVRCQGYAYMVVHNGGWCACLRRLPPASGFARVADLLCGGVCNGEADLSPHRYCGTSSTFAVYAAGA